MKKIFKHPVIRILVALVTLVSGLINIFSVIGPIPVSDLETLTRLFSLQFLEMSRFLTLLLGLALIASSINIYRRKIRAFQLVFAFACLSVVSHLVKNLDFASAAVPFLLMIVLFYSRDSFTIKSDTPNLKEVMLKLSVVYASVFAYGTAGFWFLEKNDLGINFDIGDSVYNTILSLLFMQPEDLMPQNAYVEWFLSSLTVISVVIWAYTIFALYKPAKLEAETSDPERNVVRKILKEYGDSALDFYKLWDDKRYYFSDTLKSVLAYRIEGSSIVVLGDPVGPEKELKKLVAKFNNYCSEHDWNLTFFQTSDRYLEIFEDLGFKKLKIGEEAIVDVEGFHLEGAKKKDFRNRIRKMEKLGYYTSYYEVPLGDEILVRLRQISNEWLAEPGRKERGFSLGYFQDDYVRSTPIMAVEDEDGVIVAFVNAVPSYKDGEISIDLMRKSHDAPSGVMDYLFVQFILKMQEEGYKSMNIGLAPMSGFRSHEKAAFEEVAVHSMFQKLNFLFNYIGLKVFKAKFADSWEPRYLIYKQSQDLPSIAISINKVLDAVN